MTPELKHALETIRDECRKNYWLEEVEDDGD